MSGRRRSAGGGTFGALWVHKTLNGTGPFLHISGSIIQHEATGTVHIHYMQSGKYRVNFEEGRSAFVPPLGIWFAPENEIVNYIFGCLSSPHTP